MNVGGAHLGYCTNIHAGESWAEVRANLERYTLAVKHRVAPAEPFGVGLRLSARAARELSPQIAAVRAWLDAHGLYVFTINGFPYGDFHGKRVKEQVYRPDWHEPERIAYTTLLADLLAELLPPGVDGTISTVPLCFQARDVDRGRVARNLEACCAHLAELEARRGKRIVLALEPEPACALETTAQALELLATLGARSSHLGLCLDTCHAAVEFEDPAALAGVPISKLQLSCGLRVAPVDAQARAELARFADDVYLHQVVARRGDALVRYVDLPEALVDPAPADEWRIHFHVPIFREALGRFASTQPVLAAILASRPCTHLEVETYTWDVLPAEYRAEPIEDAIARELVWVKEHLA